ncbi:IS110 family transposase [Inquilinus limosus]|uniref:IS110 family transposase n=1 Tax=Inquilinus limosus TaxID=171674 RepID=A0A211YU50_9PROT|nr:IS110 family transposase [Inquilinus limosus]OWJ56367.1 IS110 family transposase [Inquilinus limosus]
MGVFVGVDWGGGSHAVCIIDARGEMLDQFMAGHDRDGLAALILRLRKQGEPGDIRIAIERPSGLLVDALVEAGFVVVPIHPNVVKACRPRYRAVSAKSDPGDAYVLADILRTDGHRLHALKPQSDAIKALRGLVRGRDDLVSTRVALANQLTALLDSFWPGAAAVFADIASPIALAFVERYPTAESAARLGPGRMAAFLAQHSYCGRRSPEALLQRLHAAPGGHAGEAESEAKGELVRALARTLQSLVAEIARITHRIEHTVAQLPDGRIVMSFPRTGKICAAQILAELGDVRERFQTEDQLAAEAGLAPVTYQSGKSRGVAWRWACNKRLRAAITCFADNSRHQSPWAAHVYKRARARGCDHPHAIRILGRAWARVLWRAWTDQQPYDPAKHTAAKTFRAPPTHSG